MSAWKTHVVVYVGFMLLLLAVLRLGFGFVPVLETLFFGFVVGVFFSVLPDVDVGKSKARGVLAGVFVLSFLAYLVFEYLVLGVFAVFLGLFLAAAVLCRHRGFFHSWLFGFFFSLPFYVLDPVLFFFAFLGFASHLAADGRLL